MPHGPTNARRSATSLRLLTRTRGACYDKLVMAAMCPICGKEAAPRSKNASAPFCSPRCKQVDLGKWLDEKYRVETNESGDDPSNAGDSPLAAGNRKETLS